MAEGSRLGRGFAALIGDVGDDRPRWSAARQRRVPIEFLETQFAQSARRIRRSGLEELAAWIRGARHHPADPGLAARGAADQYEIVAGERRWRAAQRAGLHDVPIVLSRSAIARRSSSRSSRTCSAPISTRSKRRSAIRRWPTSSNTARTTSRRSSARAQPCRQTLRCCKLPDGVQAYIRCGKLSAGHARALLGQPNADTLAEAFVAQGLGVRQAQALARETARKARKALRAPRRRTPTRSRWRSGSPTRSGSRSAESSARPAQQYCASATRASISSATCWQGRAGRVARTSPLRDVANGFRLSFISSILCTSLADRAPYRFRFVIGLEIEPSFRRRVRCFDGRRWAVSRKCRLSPFAIRSTRFRGGRVPWQTLPAGSRSGSGVHSGLRQGASVASFLLIDLPLHDSRRSRRWGALLDSRWSKTWNSSFRAGSMLPLR